MVDQDLNLLRILLSFANLVQDFQKNNLISTDQRVQFDAVIGPKVVAECIRLITLIG